MWNIFYLPIMEKNKSIAKKVTCGFVPMRVNDFVLENTCNWSDFLLEWNDCEGTKKIIIDSFQEQLCKYFRHVMDNNLYSLEDRLTLKKCLNSFVV